MNFSIIMLSYIKYQSHSPSSAFKMNELRPLLTSVYVHDYVVDKREKGNKCRGFRGRTPNVVLREDSPYDLTFMETKGLFFIENLQSLSLSSSA